jgi:antitoxin VapB
VALYINDPEADRLARELASLTGETLKEAVLAALRERYARQQSRRSAARTAIEILSEAQERLRLVHIRDTRTAHEIIGYNELGLPDNGCRCRAGGDFLP